MSSPFGDSPFKPGYGAGPGVGPLPGVSPQYPPPRSSPGGVLAIVALAVLGTMFMCCCGVPTAMFRRTGRLHHRNEPPMPRGLLDRDDDPFEYIDEMNRQSEEELNEFRRRNNEWLKQVERDREERLRELHRRLDEL